MKTKKGYKLFKIKNGKLYPLYVLAEKEMPIGEWIEAEEGPMVDGKVKAKNLGRLAYRPGFHLAEVPNAHWIGKKMPDGTLGMRSDTVWCEVEYPTDICYSAEARENGWRNGKWSAQRACLKHIPTGGYYIYRTNSNGDPWVITGAIKILRILSDEERISICKEAGVEPQKIA